MAKLGERGAFHPNRYVVSHQLVFVWVLVGSEGIAPFATGSRTAPEPGVHERDPIHDTPRLDFAGDVSVGLSMGACGSPAAIVSPESPKPSTSQCASQVKHMLF